MELAVLGHQLFNNCSIKFGFVIFYCQIKQLKHFDSSELLNLRPASEPFILNGFLV